MSDLIYHIPNGMYLKSAGRERQIFPHEEGYFRAVEPRTGQFEILTYNEVITALNSPDASTRNSLASDTQVAARLRQGGLHYRHQLSKWGQDLIDFRLAIIAGVDELEAHGIKLTMQALNDADNRKKIRETAKMSYTSRPICISPRGGSVKNVAVLPKGRTILAYRKRFIDSGFDEMSLVDQYWLRGNRTDHGVPTRVLELMTEAVEHVSLDTKKPNVSSALRKLVTLVHEENEKRAINALPALSAVSHKTLSSHIKKIGSTALTIARDGERVVATNRSRGATDTRSLMVGEFAEVDECKLSLMTAVKAKGYWQHLSEEQKTTLEEIDEIIHTRLFLIVILDVATRMPLAWVLTDRPCAEATAEALRMATRDKTREKIMYGCESDPMPAVGIACLKGDNGTGIRNASVKSVALGMNIQTIY
ncbi:MAG: hypothetical protein ACPG6L_03300 [Nereida ignava]